MDYLNPYGIHPFHPFDSRWFYGDMVFILEPVFWVSFGVPMAMMVPLRALKILFLALLAGALLYFTLKGFLPWTALAALAGAAAMLGMTQWRSSPRGRGALVLGMCILAGFVAIQALASAQGKRVVAHYAMNKDPAARLLDVSMSSFPSNPFCWVFASVESNENAGTYRLRRGIVSVAPQTVPVSTCPPALSAGSVQQALTPALAVVEERQGSLSALRALRIANCHFDAWMRFARMPAVDDTQATDIRFASSPRGNFTTMRFDQFNERACPRDVPGWSYPRADLLQP
jgi:inner membrane protein